MTTATPFLRVAICGVLVAACDQAPTEVPASAGRASVQSQQGFVAANVAGPKMQSISGTVQFVGRGVPGRILMTPSDRCHFWDTPVFTNFGGDVTGSVTFHVSLRAPCDFSHVNGSGPFDGEVTWNGRSGIMSGQWTTNCIADPAQPIGISCDGTMNARGSGGLEGVHFHFTWGPGFFPFSYTGTVFSK